MLPQMVVYKFFRSGGLSSSFLQVPIITFNMSRFKGMIQ